MIRRAFLLLCLVWVICLIATRAAGSPPPPVDDSPSDLVRVWGHPSLRPLVACWQAGFQKTSPGVRIELRFDGSDVAMAGLTTAHADVALLGRDATAAEVKAFEWIYRRKPVRLEVATGSLATPGASPALVVFVHRDNPLAHLTLAQLDAIFGTERRGGAPAPLRTWGDLGLPGEWAAQPLNLHAPHADNGTGRFFQETVLGDSRKWHWDRLREFSGDNAAAETLAALATDRFGLAVASFPAADPRVKPLALAVSAASSAVTATAESVAARAYPLTRTVCAYLNRAPDAPPAKPAVTAFLRYVLSEAGQRDIAAAGAYFPLPPTAAAAQAKRFD